MMERDNNNYTKLLKNTFVFGLGTFGSKVLQFLIVPLYTYVLSTEEYGQIDIFVTTISLVIPFVTFLVQEAIIRFLTAKEITQEDAINSGMLVFVNSILMGLLITPVYAFVFDSEYAVVFFICLLLNSFVAIFQNYLKACGLVTAFTICGLINTVSFLIANVVLLLLLKLGVQGYMYSIIISQFISAVFIISRGNIIKKCTISRKHFPVLKQMLRFSLPLIPNNLMWWIMNAGDKYIINFFLGDGANGLYSLSIKLATVVSTIFSVFMQAWQLSAIEEHGKDEQASFYSKVYSHMMALLLFITSLIIVLNRPLFSVIIGEQFFEAHLYSPLLCVATIINCMSTFFGVTYLVSKYTQKAFTTTVIGALLNVVANFLLIKQLGLVGVAFGTIIGYLVVLLIRMHDTNKQIDMSFDLKRTVPCLIIIFCAAIIYMYLDSMFSIILGCVCLLIFVVVYRNEVHEILDTILKKVKGRK